MMTIALVLTKVKLTLMMTVLWCSTLIMTAALVLTIMISMALVLT